MPLALSISWLAVFTLACYGVGVIAWRLFIGRDATTYGDLTLVLGLGAGVLAALAGVLAVCGVMTRTPVLIVLAVSAAKGGISASRRWSDIDFSPLPRSSLFLLLAAAVIGVLGASSMASFYDQWNYHLAFPYQWLRAGTIITFPRHAYSFFHANMGLLYVYGLAASGGWAAQLIHWWMGALAVAGAGSLAHRFVPASGPVAATIVATTPGVIELGTVAGAELGVAAFFVCAWLAVLRMADSSEGSQRWGILAGIFVGLAVGCKYLAIPLLAIPLGIVAPLFGRSQIGGRNQLVTGIQNGLIIASTALLIWSPWAIRNVILTGDPVYPYLSTQDVGSAEQTGEEDRDLAEGIGGVGWSRERLFFAATLGSFDHRDVGGRVGPVFLWLMPLWFMQLIVGSISTRERLFAAALLLGLFGAAFIPPFGRYLVPLAALSAVGCAASFQRLTETVSRPWGTALRALLIVVLIGNLNPFPFHHLTRQIGVTLGVVDEDEFLSTYVSHYPAIAFINSELPADAVIYFLAEARSFEIERRLLLEDPISKPLVVEIAESSRSTEQMVEQFSTLGVTHILINQLEAKRMARYNNRSDYLVTDDPAARQRIFDFLDVLPVVWQDRHLTIFRLPQALESSR